MYIYIYTILYLYLVFRGDQIVILTILTVLNHFAIFDNANQAVWFFDVPVLRPYLAKYRVFGS